MGVDVETVLTPFEAKLVPVTTFDDLPKPVPARLAEIQRRRIGIYKSFQPAIDEGWTRWISSRCPYHTPP